MEKWIEDLIGCPYLENGLDPAIGLDCFGLVRYIIYHDFGVELPKDPHAWRRYGVILPANIELQKYDILFFSRRADGLTDHMGMAISPFDFIHANEMSGQVVCESTSHAMNKLKAVGRVFAAIKNDL